MSRAVGIASVILLTLMAMGFAAANAGHRVTLDLGVVVLYRFPVTLVAFGGLFLGMLVMFLAGVHTDLKVRRILRERLAEETRQEQEWIDRNQQDLFVDQPPSGDGDVRREASSSPEPARPSDSDPSVPEGEAARQERE